MSYKKHEKQELPNGWVVKQSKTYPDKVYYFNTLTGVSTWEIPELLKPYLKSSEGKLSNKHAVSSRIKAEIRPAPILPRSNYQEAQFSPTQDSDENDSLDLELPHDGTDFCPSNSIPSVSYNSANLHSDTTKQSNPLGIVKQHVKSNTVSARQQKDLCKVQSLQTALDKPLPPSNSILPKSVQQDFCKTGKEESNRPLIASNEQIQHYKAPTKKITLDKNSVKSENIPHKKVIKLSSHKASSEKMTLKRGAESLSQDDKPTNKRLKADGLEEWNFCDTRKVVKRSPPSAFDTCNLSPRESSPDNLLLNDPKKREDIQSWINHLESDDPASDPLGDFSDPTLDQGSPDSGTFSLENDNRKVLVQSYDSGFLSVGDTSNLSNITLTIKNDGPVKKAVVNPWKGVHETPVPINQKRREEISMEIDEVQQVLTKEDDREIEEMDVSDIVLKEVRESVKKCPSEVIGTLTQVFTSDQPGHIQSVDHGLHIVVDTNVFISNLAFVQDLRDHCFEQFGLPNLVIPWVVMQELDALKSNKSSAATMSMKIGKCARAAVHYIYQCFMDNHQRVIGQSATQASAASKEFQAECNDDRILQTCLQCQKNRMNSTVILLSNDKNLLSKARICKIPAFDSFLLMNGVKSLQPHCLNKIANKNYPALVPSESKQTPSKSHAISPSVPPESLSQLLDEMLCKLKMWLKNALSSVLEREMKAAYDDIWLEIVLKKPPWTLSDLLECFKKHWIAVFGQIYRRNLSTVVDRLLARFKINADFHLSFEIYRYLLNDCLELLEECYKHKKDDTSVSEALSGLKKCEQLCHDLKAGNVKVSNLEAYLAGKQMPAESKTKECMDKNKNRVEHLSIEDVESKLTNIWDVVYFCCEDFQGVIDNRRKNGSTNPERLQKMMVVFQKLIPALDGIRYEYEQALRFSPKDILDKAALVHGLCVQLNSFYIRLNLEAKDGNLEVANVQALFGMESKRQMLKDGLDHLDKMIHKIHEQVKMMQG
ncbi:transcriptional protein SWT1-like isoform X2 [Saccostrea echinata]|uniref:transcriptional protein SWT1-like isoform X2 n=1 Tax=Saccostrea echinata TaxID=191078 RepID=UPI002A81848D|nr:transcriptional protein SWT1-like isoform X2 [Saccostrea echinata]